MSVQCFKLVLLMLFRSISLLGIKGHSG